MRSSDSSRYGLFVVSAIVLALAFGLWNERAHRAALQQSVQQERRQAQHSVALLIRAFVADNQLKYSAISDTMAMYGEQTMRSTARITRTPESLAIVYLTGDKKGLHSGFNDRWFWRQSNPGAPMQAYASMKSDATAMAAKRFAALLENYNVQWLRRDTIEGRAVEVVEIRPARPVDGAKGPGKLLGIDEKTGLTVLTQTFNYQWRPVMRSTLTQIDFSPTITPATFQSPSEMFDAAKKKPWMAQEMGDDRADVTRATGVQPPRPKYLPPGFIFDGVGTHRCDAPTGATFAALTRYTDGLNTLTVFAMKKDGAQKTKNDASGTTGDAELSCDFGPGTLVMRDAGAAHIIAVGDLPPQTLRRVVNDTSLQMAP